MITEYPIRSRTPVRMVYIGPDGRCVHPIYLWPVDAFTTTGRVHRVPITTSASSPYGIRHGQDGTSGSRDVRTEQSPAHDRRRGYGVRGPAGQLPQGITAGPDGRSGSQNRRANKSADLDAGAIYRVPTLSPNPVEITSGPDGRCGSSNTAQ